MAAWGRRYAKEAAARSKASDANARKTDRDALRDADKAAKRVSEEIACVLLHH